MTRRPTEALADFIGLEVCLAALRSLHEGYGDVKYRPAALLVKGGNAVGKIKRSDFGMKYGVPSVSDEIGLNIEFEGDRD